MKQFKKMMKTLETRKNKKRTSKSSTQKWSRDSEKRPKRNKKKLNKNLKKPMTRTKRDSLKKLVRSNKICCLKSSNLRTTLDTKRTPHTTFQSWLLDKHSKKKSNLLRNTSTIYHNIRKRQIITNNQPL
jgi:hypothetical protein